MNFLNFTNVLANLNIAEGSGAAAAPVATAGSAVAPVAEQAAAGGLFGGIGTTGIIIYVIVLAGLYFFLIRPQKKREKQVKEMQAALGIGENVVTSSGMFGTIVSVGEDCFVVEFGTNKGVRIPIRKSDIIGVKAPTLTAPKEVITTK